MYLKYAVWLQKCFSFFPGKILDFDSMFSECFCQLLLKLLNILFEWLLHDLSSHTCEVCGCYNYTTVTVLQ
jgi:hypothetical protein